MFFRIIVAAGCLVAASPTQAAECNLREAAQLYRDDIIRELGERSDQKSDLGNSGSLVRNCGQGTELINTIANGVVNFELPNRTISLIPLYFNDKDTNKWNCTRIKVRLACLTTKKLPTGEYSVTLSNVAQKAPAYSATFRIGTDGKITAPEDERHFWLVPAVRKFEGEKRELASFVPARAKKTFPCESYADCEDQQGYHAERILLEIYRTQRFFDPGWPDDWTPADKSSFAAALPELGDSRRAIHDVVSRNETGEFSPYRLIDAIKESSGPSYGPYQIDLATNPRDLEEKKPFRDLILQHVQDKGYEPELRTLILNKIFEKSIREYDTATLTKFYKHLAFIDDGLRSPSGRQTVRSVYLDYLDRLSRAYDQLRLREPYKSSPVLAMLWVDAENLLGQPRSDYLKDAIEKSFRKNGSQDEAEAAARNWILANAKARARCDDATRRLNNVLKYFNKEPVDERSCQS